MNDIRARFEEIWSVPEGVWFEGDSYRAGWDETEWRLAADFNIRLDTFIRCQETTDVYVSLVEEMVQLLRDIEGQMDEDEHPSLGYDIECRMAAVLRPAKSGEGE